MFDVSAMLAELETLRAENEALKAAMRNRQELLFVDATPDADYPMRILRAHRDGCDNVWTDNTAGVEPSNELCRLMNDLQRQRATRLDAAIANLRRHRMVDTTCRVLRRRLNLALEKLADIEKLEAKDDE